jgi:DNA-binding NarL/FixJ family response regulator
MLTANLTSAAAPTAAADRRALLVGQQLAVVERFMPLLRLSNFDVRRTLRPTGTIRLVRELPFELVVVVLPFPELGELLEAVRAEESPCRNAAVLLIAEDGEPQVRDELLMRLANRVLPAQASAAELDKALVLLLDVAPRVPMHGAVRVRLSAQQVEPRVLRLENVSASGMLVTGREPLPVGSLFGFELELPEEKAPIRGQAKVVRHAPALRPGEQALGASFVAVGGEGNERLREAILRERAAAGGGPRNGHATPAGTPAAIARGPAGRKRVVPARHEVDLAQLREELGDLAPFVDDILRRGLARRLGVADWYVTGVELGLESLGAFAAILETVYRGHGSPADRSRHIADLTDVRRQLAEFAEPGQSLPERVEILVGIRPALERLLRELAESGGDEPGSGARQRGVVSHLVVDVQRVLRARKGLDNLQGLLAELQHPRYLIARGARRRRADEIYMQYRGYAASLGLAQPDALMSRRGLRAALALTEREAQRTDDWLAAIHAKVYPGRLRSSASGDVTTDFAEDRLFPVVAQVLAAGYDYLVRAYSAYRHALEMCGADPGLLDRVAGLAAAVEAAERRPSAAPQLPLALATEPRLGHQRAR